jgi:hypothetical protein
MERSLIPKRLNGMASEHDRNQKAGFQYGMKYGFLI